MRPEQIENYQLARLIELAECQTHLLRIIAEEVAPGRPRLSHSKLEFKRRHRRMANPGPVTLTSAGQQVTASVVGFDQFGQPFTGEMPAATFTSDDTAQAIVQFDPQTGLTTAVANGVANITATLTTNEGLSLSDTEAVTVAIPVVPPPTPVLSSIKVAFA
jgi:hypothetical protein